MLYNPATIDMPDNNGEIILSNFLSDNGIPVPDYIDENVSDKVVKIIQSYVGVVNKMVWRKDS